MDETTNETPKQGNSMMIIIVIVIVLIIGGVVYMMMKNKSQTTQTSETNMNQNESANQAQPTTAQNAMTASNAATAAPSAMESEAMEDSTVKTFNIEAGSFYYKPNVISVKKGDKVKVVMHSVDMMHNFNIDELNVKLPMTKSGETNTVEFTASKVGTFEFYCSVGNHRANGQVGKITITE